MHILDLPTDIFNVYPAMIKFKTYQARWQIGDIYVSGDARKTEDNPQGLGCYLVMTGRGCDDIFRILDSRNYTFGDMFRRCERRYGLDNFHFTRLDIAIDDKNEKPFFTIEQIKKKCEKEEFISNSEGYHFDESKFDDFDTAKTVYIGAGKSGLSYRFYDKDKEVCSKHNKTLDEVGSWKRTEMQLRDDKAHVFAMTFKDRPLELGELAFGLLSNNLRFVVPNRNESNKSRWTSSSPNLPATYHIVRNTYRNNATGSGSSFIKLIFTLLNFQRDPAIYHVNSTVCQTSQIFIMSNNNKSLT